MKNIILKKEHVDELEKLKPGERCRIDEFHDGEDGFNYLVEQVRRVRGGYLFTAFETKGDDIKRKYYFVKKKEFDGEINPDNSEIVYEKAVRLSVAVLKANRKFSTWFFVFDWNYPPQKKFFCDFADLLRGKIDFMCLGATSHTIESEWSRIDSVEALFRRGDKLYAYETDSLTIVELDPLDDTLYRCDI